MTVIVHTASVTNNANSSQIANLLADDDLIVGPDATLVATGAGSVVVRATTLADMAIDGNLYSASNVILATGGGHDIDIGLDALLRSVGSAPTVSLGDGGNRIVNAGQISGGGIAVYISGGDNLVVNRGDMEGHLSSGLLIEGADNNVINRGSISSVNGVALFIDGDSNYILNSGTISSDDASAVETAGIAGQTTRLFNTGTISSTDEAAFVGGATEDEVTNRGTMIGSVYLGDGEDELDSRGGTIEGFIDGGGGSDFIIATHLDDYINGGTGNDALFGMNGDDILYGEEDDDILFGGVGADLLSGGTGTDRADYRLATSGVTASLADADDNTGEAAGDEYESIENLQGSRFGDTLVGSNLANLLVGGLGRDVLAGAKGADSLTGNAGRDTFLFDTTLGPTNVDSINDFEVPDDTIRLARTVFTEIALGELDLDAFRVGAASADAEDRIVYNKATGELFYDKDGTGAAAAVKFATIATNLTLKADDFFVV